VPTGKGRKANLSHDGAYNLVKAVYDSLQRDEQVRGCDALAGTAVTEADTGTPDHAAYFNRDHVRAELVGILRGVTDKGFEQLCARLLRHIGFENLKVTGQTGDHGIDGEGFLLIKRFIRIKVMFQCKRYAGTVQVKEIRDFRGAIQGRSEHGIFLTTGTFTKGAREEAARENATAIELVDIDRLLVLLIEEGLGICETKALIIDHAFFAPYRRTD
jgi:restriction system protein